MVLEGWHFIDSLYMTVITLSTVGFGEVRPLSAVGRLFTSGLIMAGVGSVAYLFGAIGHSIVSGELTGSWRSRRMQQRIDALRGHYVICGLGRVGLQVTLDLEQRNIPWVAVDASRGVLDETGTTFLSVTGDAKDDDTLKRAGIERARGLVAATGDDADNLFITVTARALNPDLLIVARANHPSTEPKLLRAGARHVISPYTITGHRIATQLLHPSVNSFLDLVMHSGDLGLWLEECAVQLGADLNQKTVAEAQVRQRTGANVLAVHRRQEERVISSPPREMRLEPGDVLIAVGTREQLAALHKLAVGT
jgi:voltage-gated potassium channel